MEKRLIIVMAGGGASGKSTTSKAFAIGDPIEYMEKRPCDTMKGIRPMKVNWTLYDNYALAGSHHSGTDSNTGPGVIYNAFFECLQHRDTVIVDGKITSPRWVLMCNDAAQLYDVQVCVLYFQLSGECMLERLAKRRGATIASITPKTRSEVFVGVRRAKLLVNQFKELCEVPYDILTVEEQHTTDDIVAMLDDYVCGYFQDCDGE